MKTKQKISSSSLILIISMILFVSLAYNIYQLVRKDKLNVNNIELNKKNTFLDDKFKDAKVEINKYKGLSSYMDKVINEANLKIAEKEKRIRMLTGDSKSIAAENERMLIEINELKESYLETIDSLLVSKKQNDQLNTTLESMENKISELNKKLGIGERMLVDNFVITPQKTSRSGKTNTTALARNTNELKICLNLMKNKIAETGPTKIYIRIFSPEGPVIVSPDAGSGDFVHPEYKIEVPYSKVEEINYTNQTMEFCTTWDKTENYPAGLYLVELSTDKYVLGSTTFTLK